MSIVTKIVYVVLVAALWSLFMWDAATVTVAPFDILGEYGRIP